MSDSKSSSSGGIGFCGLLAIVFITLKLLDKIDWPWLWVLAPLWIPVAIVLTFLAGCGLVWAITALVMVAIDAYHDRQRKKRRAKLNKVA